MCTRPILIDNPYYGCNQTYKGAGGTLRLERTLSFLHDTTSLKMAVPCGHCAQCVAMKQSYIVQRSQMEADGNDLWFCTLTYKTSMLKYIDVNGYRLRYAYLPDLQNMIKRMRKKDLFGMPFRFWAVVEYGGMKHRPHFHLIFSTPKIPGESRASKLAREKRYYWDVLHEWKRNTATCIDRHGRTQANTRSPKYEDLCEYKVTYKNGKRRCTYDFHWIDPCVTDTKGKIHDEADVAFYVTKYTTKANKYVDRLKSALRLNLDPDEFTAIWKILRPKCLVSKKWGDPDSETVRKHVRSGIDRALQDADAPFPYFINPSTGQTFPLAPFYKKRFLKIEDALSFFYKQKDDYGTGDNFRVGPDVDPLVERQKDMRFERMLDMINAREEDDPFTPQTTKTYEAYTEEDWLIDDYCNSLIGLDIGLFNPVDEFGNILYSDGAEPDGDDYIEFDPATFENFRD